MVLSPNQPTHRCATLGRCVPAAETSSAEQLSQLLRKTERYFFWSRVKNNGTGSFKSLNFPWPGFPWPGFLPCQLASDLLNSDNYTCVRAIQLTPPPTTGSMGGMEEPYPRTILELEDRFATEDACREYLMHLRWPDGFVCPRCKHLGGWLATRGRVVCKGCRHQASVTAGTIFQDTHKPLRLWFRAIWQVTSQKNGASALNLQQVLGLGSYLTAWTWLHKLRRAMVRPGRDCLRGRVEVDETYVGGESEGKDGRGTDKALVVIAVEEDGSGMGRTRMARIPDETRNSLHRFIQASIQPGSHIHTDGNSAWFSALCSA